jgi:hypothetical protein
MCEWAVFAGCDSVAAARPAAGELNNLHCPETNGKVLSALTVSVCQFGKRLL